MSLYKKYYSGGSMWRNAQYNGMNAQGAASGSGDSMGTSSTGGSGMGWTAAIPMAAAMGAEAVGNGDSTGFRTQGGMVGKNALKGASYGATLGSSFGPIGTLIGGAAGTLIGGAAGLIGARGKQAKYRREQENKGLEKQIQDDNYAGAVVAADPSSVYGNRRAEMFKDGGDMKSPLTSLYMSGGTPKSLSSNNAEMEGNSHAQGGIKVPSTGSEVENGETTAGSYVFSKALGFADQHKPIARAIGKIELKPMTKERLTTMNLLKDRENKLASLQEHYKATHGLK